jgi:hypothetical protein
VSLNVIRCNKNPLHLQRGAKSGKRRKKERKRERLSKLRWRKVRKTASYKYKVPQDLAS